MPKEHFDNEREDETLLDLCRTLSLGGNKKLGLGWACRRGWGVTACRDKKALCGNIKRRASNSAKGREINAKDEMTNDTE